MPSMPDGSDVYILRNVDREEIYVCFFPELCTLKTPDFIILILLLSSSVNEHNLHETYCCCQRMISKRHLLKENITDDKNRFTTKKFLHLLFFDFYIF